MNKYSDKDKIVESIINKMTGDETKNIRVMKNKLRFFNTSLSLKDFVSKHIKKKMFSSALIYTAIETYLLTCSNSKCNDLIMEQDKDGNNFLHIAIDNGFDLIFIKRCICLFKYMLEPYELITPFINQINNKKQNFMHAMLYSILQYDYVFLQFTHKSIAEMNILFKMLLNLGLDYKSVDIYDKDMLTIILKLYDKTTHISNCLLIPSQKAKIKAEMFLTIEKFIFAAEYTSDFLKFKYSPYTFVNIFKSESFELYEIANRRLINTHVGDFEIFRDTTMGLSPIYYIVKLAIEEGMNDEIGFKIMQHVLESFLPAKEIYYIYSLFRKHGYSINLPLEKFNYIIEQRNKTKNNNVEDSKYIDMLRLLYKQNNFLSFLKEEFSNKNLNFDNDFILKYDKCYIEFLNLWNALNDQLGIKDKHLFANMVITDILEKRQQYINTVNNDISIDEIINSLISLFENHKNNIQNKIDNVKIKILDN